MGIRVRGSSSLLFHSLLYLLLGYSSVLSQDLKERDALCNLDGCFVVYFQHKTFLESWRACKEKGGDLATIKHHEDATSISTLFSTLDLRHSRTKVMVWIGLQRQPRHCTSTDPLRGYSWTSGDQDTLYTNWQREDSPTMCLVPQCVAMSFNTQVQADNFKWLDISCSTPVDGYLCHYTYKGMCSALWNEGAGNALYSTPFNLLSTVLTHIPFGSVASVPCPSGAEEEESVFCTLRKDDTVGWSREPPLCSESDTAHNWCDHNNGGCEHFCRPTGSHFYCECADGYQLRGDGQSCELFNVCEGSPCEFECLPLSDGFRCACPDGYMLATNEHGCLDVDECLQSPCEQLCENVLGSFQCQCRKGFYPDGLGGCEDIDECISNPCEHACENTAGSHICHCHLGYSLIPEDLSHCQDTDECQIAGTCEQMCVNYEGGFECYCEEGFELMPDHYSCQKRSEVDSHAAVTPNFPWVSHQPGLVWDTVDYEWNPEQSHTGWPTEEEQHVEWLTDPSSISKSDVIWVTRAPHDELPIDSRFIPLTQEGDKGDLDDDIDDLIKWGIKSKTQKNIFPTPPPPAPQITATSPPAHLPTSSLTTFDATSTPSTTLTPDWYEEEEEATTPIPLPSSSTAAEGAWNWWVEFATSSRSPAKEDQENSFMDDKLSTDSSYGSQSGVGNAKFPDIVWQMKGDTEQVTHQSVIATMVPTLPSTTQLPLDDSGGTIDLIGIMQEDKGQKKSNSWLLVGLLVPICILIVAMVALGTVYCTRCTVQPQNKSAADCYHWMSGAHDRQGVQNPSAGVKAQV